MAAQITNPIKRNVNSITTTARVTVGSKVRLIITT